MEVDKLTTLVAAKKAMVNETAKEIEKLEEQLGDLEAAQKEADEERKKGNEAYQEAKAHGGPQLPS